MNKPSLRHPAEKPFYIVALIVNMVIILVALGDAVCSTGKQEGVA